MESHIAELILWLAVDLIVTICYGNTLCVDGYH